MEPTTALPLELWMHITDMLLEDPDDLLSLALTCRSMVPLCHGHIFSTVALSCDEPESVAEYTMLIKSNPELGRYLKDFTYEINPSSIPHEECNAHLQSLQAHASALQSLTLYSGGCDWNRLPGETQDVLVALTQLPTITCINIMSFVNFPITSLAHCPNLDSMMLSLVSEDNSTDVSKLSARSKIPAPRTVDCELGGVLVPMMTSTHPGGEPLVEFGNLRKAFFVIEKEEDSPLHLRILEMATLHTLKIGVRTPNSLLPLHASRTVPRRVFVIVVDEAQDDPLCGLSCALGHIARSNCMEELEIRVYILNEGYYNRKPRFWDILNLEPSWVNLDMELTAPGVFPLLRSVKVVLNWCWNRRVPVERPRPVLRAEWFRRLLNSTSVVFSFSEDHMVDSDADISASEW